MAETRLPTAIETATTDQLVAELVRRSAAIVVLQAPLIEPTSSSIWVYGNLYTCYGMIDEVDTRVCNQIDSIREARKRS